MRLRMECPSSVRIDRLNEAHGAQPFTEGDRRLIPAQCLSNALRLQAQSRLKIFVPGMRFHRIERALAGILIGCALERAHLPAPPRRRHGASPRAGTVPYPLIKTDIATGEGNLGEHHAR